MMDAHDTYLMVLKRVSNGEVPLQSKQRLIIKPGNHLPISNANFSARRWVTYCDQYLKGGPEFEQFLNNPSKWEFVNDAGHKAGACIRSLEIRDKQVVMKSRVLQLAPVGVLDFKLVNMVASSLQKPVEWEIECMRAPMEFLVSVAHLFPKSKTRWLKNFWDRYEQNKETTFGRHQAQYHDASKVKEETIIKDCFTFSIMRDFSWLYKGGISGWKHHDRIFTRVLRPWRQDEGWVFNAHPQSMKHAIREHIPSLPSLASIATSRSARMSKISGVSLQSTIQGYLK